MAKNKPYVENSDFTPEPTDIVAQFNTTGLGASDRIEEVSPVFEADRVAVAEQVQAALDPKDSSVPASRVALPETVSDNETARKELLDRAKTTQKEVGKSAEEIVQNPNEPTPAQREAQEKGDSGSRAAQQQEASNAAQHSTGTGTGQHTAPQAQTSTPPAKKSASSGGSTSGSTSTNK